ncbi:MAG: ABC transporter ATP-binding protein [Actinomycetes bacterium]|nr:ABC transporter ATP-binding protein [Acidimicrobiia bacterium]
MADVLVADSIEKIYGEGDTATRALEAVSFEVAEGEFASIVGQSGSGKSTLLNLLGLLDTPTSGAVTLAGQDTSGLSRRQRARLRSDTIGFVFQFHHLLPEFTVFENMTMPLRISGQKVGDAERKRVSELLELMGIGGLEKKNANQLSGGQKQRVAIGRALMKRPDIVLADEPTGNLDTANTDAVYELFRSINEELGTGFLIVTHDRGVAEMTDRILEVSDGKLVQDVRNDYV